MAMARTLPPLWIWHEALWRHNHSEAIDEEYSMTSRERVQMVLNSKVPNHVPMDVEGSSVTGMHGDRVYKLHQKARYDAPPIPVVLGLAEGESLGAGRSQ